MGDQKWSTTDADTQSMDSEKTQSTHSHEKGDTPSLSASVMEEAQQNQRPTIPPPPNGGYGWVCTGCSFMINFNTWGVNSSYGVILAALIANDTYADATKLDYAFVGGLSIGCALAASPLATSCVRWFGTKPTLAIGAFLEILAFIAASFAHKIWHLYLTQGVCFGLGMGFLFVSSVGIVPQWFTTRRSLANGIATAGSGLGGLVYSLAIGAMIPAIGLGWTYRVLGILVFVMHGICILLIKDRNKIIGSKQLAFDYKLFARPEYLLICFYGFLSMLGYVVLIFSLANYANSIGLSGHQAATVSALFNLGQAIGRPPVGYFSDTIGRINMAAGMTFLCAVFTLTIWVNAHTYGVLIFYAIISGMVAGTFWTTAAPVSVEVVGLKHVPSALNLLWLFITLPSLFSEPIALEIIAGTGQYIGTQLFAGTMYVAAALCLLLLRGWKINELALLEPASGKIEEITEDEELEARQQARKGMLIGWWKLAKV